MQTKSERCPLKTSIGASSGRLRLCVQSVGDNRLVCISLHFEVMCTVARNAIDIRAAQGSSSRGCSHYRIVLQRTRLGMVQQSGSIGPRCCNPSQVRCACLASDGVCRAVSGQGDACSRHQKDVSFVLPGAQVQIESGHVSKVSARRRFPCMHAAPFLSYWTSQSCCQRSWKIYLNPMCSVKVSMRAPVQARELCQ